MAIAKLKQIWEGNCETCGTYFPFSPDKPFFKDSENQLKCTKCGQKYFIDRELGTYNITGSAVFVKETK